MSTCSNILLGLKGIVLLLLLIKTQLNKNMFGTCICSKRQWPNSWKKKIPLIPWVHLNSTSMCLTFAQQQQHVRDGTCDGNASPGCPQPNTCIYKRTICRINYSRRHPPGKRHSETDALNRHSNKGRAGAAASDVDKVLASMHVGIFFFFQSHIFVAAVCSLQMTRRRRWGHSSQLQNLGGWKKKKNLRRDVTWPADTLSPSVAFARVTLRPETGGRARTGAQRRHRGSHTLETETLGGPWAESQQPRSLRLCLSLSPAHSLSHSASATVCSRHLPSVPHRPKRCFLDKWVPSLPVLFFSPHCWKENLQVMQGWRQYMYVSSWQQVQSVAIAGGVRLELRPHKHEGLGKWNELFHQVTVRLLTCYLFIFFYWRQVN